MRDERDDTRAGVALPDGANKPQPRSALSNTVTRTRPKLVPSLLAGIAALTCALSVVGCGSDAKAAYPESVRTDFLDACVQSASIANCRCRLAAHEARTPLAQFKRDVIVAATGGRPSHMFRAAEADCP